MNSKLKSLNITSTIGLLDFRLVKKVFFSTNDLRIPGYSNCNSIFLDNLRS